ncbi:unnamed protein product [Cochlearia groenlandica]
MDNNIIPTYCNDPIPETQEGQLSPPKPLEYRKSKATIGIGTTRRSWSSKRRRSSHRTRCRKFCTWNHALSFVVTRVRHGRCTTVRTPTGSRRRVAIVGVDFRHSFRFATCLSIRDPEDPLFALSQMYLCVKCLCVYMFCGVHSRASVLQPPYFVGTGSCSRSTSGAPFGSIKRPLDGIVDIYSM